MWSRKPWKYSGTKKLPKNNTALTGLGFNRRSQQVFCWWSTYKHRQFIRPSRYRQLSSKDLLPQLDIKQSLYNQSIGWIPTRMLCWLHLFLLLFITASRKRSHIIFAWPFPHYLTLTKAVAAERLFQFKSDLQFKRVFHLRLHLGHPNFIPQIKFTNFVQPMAFAADARDLKILGMVDFNVNLCLTIFWGVAVKRIKVKGQKTKFIT